MARHLPLTTALFAYGIQPMVMGRWMMRTFTRQFATTLKQVPRSTLVGRLLSVSAVDARAARAQRAVPCLYVQAQNDWLVPKRAALDFETVASLPGPHFLLQACPLDSANQIALFLDKVFTAGPAP